MIWLVLCHADANERKQFLNFKNAEMRNKLKRPRKLRFNASDFETAVKEYKENGCSREGILSLLTLAFVAVFFIFKTVRSQSELANYITFFRNRE